ncbi:hypothetical protein KY290_014891 [Solanum tuberosum]|uniref:Integrase core domain containing protein n=1 Tax=Solanum tuberosum TaxID=4113 RepID=A0ABQ7VSX9_SOLTU|nr:hypothetical protein KY290_014891 [Solanum tuberosum]
MDVVAKQSHNVFGDGSHTSSIRGFIPTKWPARIINTAYNKYQVPATHQLFIGNRMHSHPNSYYSIIPPIQQAIDLPIHGAQSNPLIVSNNDGSTNDQAPNEALKEKTKKEAAKEREDVVVVAAAKQQKEAEIQENIRILAQQLHYVLGDRPHTYTPRKRLCDVFGDPSNTSRPIKTVSVTNNEKNQVSEGKNTHPRQPLRGNRMRSYQNSYYSRIPPIRMTVDLPVSSPMDTTTQGREVVVAAAVRLEEGVGDNFT